MPGVIKHFTMGRMAHENAVIMPDWKTVYLTDDGGNKAFFKFVATTPGDLSAGTLYAAKVIQDGTIDSAKAGFDITWIELGTSDNASIENLIRSYDGIEATDYVDGDTNFVSQAEIDAYDPSGPHDELAFIESLRVAEALGATVEFNKMEGININYDGVAGGSVPFMYVAMADVTGAMTDGAGDMQITTNRCGIVYRFGLTATYDVLRMEPVVVGGAYDGTSTTDRCDPEGIAQPDNITVLDDGRVLIGEDSSNHLNNMLWIYNPSGT